MSKYIGTKAVNLSTTSADVTGNADIDGNLTVGGNLTVSGTTITVDSATAQTVDLGDDDKIRLGDDDDLQIYHDSATGNSVINESGGGNLTIQGNELRLQTAGGGNYFRGINAGASSIFYSNSIRLETTTNGVKAHGNVVSEAASAPELVLKSYPGTQDTIAKIISGRSEFSGTNSFLRLQTNDGTSTETRIDISDGGDISFFDDSGNAKLFWDASKESVGIGTTSLTPTDGANIELSSATSSRIILDSTGTGGRKYTMASGTNGSLDFYDYDASAYRMRLDHSGNVGIGVTPSSWRSADVALQLAGTAAEYANFVSGGGGVTYGAGWYRDGATNNFKYTFSSLPAGRFDYNYTGSNVFSWHQAAAGTAGNDITFSEAMRIDATGKLLIGKTDTSINVQGHRFDPQGQAQHVGTNDSTLYLNRKSSYGDVANFYYNGSYDGSIQVDAGFINVGSGETRLAFIDSGQKRIIPRKGHSTVSDGLIDLGDSGSEFKNLYLNGGVVFGSTGGNVTSKTLDDYEEGTWTPTANHGTISYLHNRYTKIGREVTVSAFIYNFSDRTTAAAIGINGLPFTTSASSRTVGSVMIRYSNNTSITASYATASSTAVEFYGVHSASWDVLQYSDLNSGSAEIYFTISYTV